MIMNKQNRIQRLFSSANIKLRKPFKKQAAIAEIEKAIYRKILNPGKRNKKKLALKIIISKKDKIMAAMICAVILILAVASVYYYNIFINLEYDIEADLAQIDTQIQKRKNLMINLGLTVVEYSKHEREIFSHLAELRADNGAENFKNNFQNLMNSRNPNLKPMDSNIENWGRTLSQLMAVAEEYPDLELSENFRKYMDAILEFENKIAELRMTYNNSVNQYSTLKDQFPGVVFAFVLGFEDFEYFRLDIDEKGFMKVE